MDDDPFPEPRPPQQRRRGRSRPPDKGSERAPGRRSGRPPEPAEPPPERSGDAGAPDRGADPHPPPHPPPHPARPPRPERPGEPPAPGGWGTPLNWLEPPSGDQPRGHDVPGYRLPDYGAPRHEPPGSDPPGQRPPEQEQPADQDVPFGLYSTPPPTRRADRDRRQARLPGPPRDPADQSATGASAAARGGDVDAPGGWSAQQSQETARVRSRTRGAGGERPAPGGGGLWLLGAAVVLVLWSVTCLLDLSQPGIAAAAALSPMITVLAIPLVALGVGRRHPLPAAVATLAAALPWVLVASYGAAGPGPTSPAAGAALRIMTVDANGGSADARRIAELAKVYAADVVVVTELTSTLAHDLTVEGLNSVVTARVVQMSADGTAGVGIWTRAALNDAKEVGGLSRPAASGILQTTNGPVGVLAAHSADSALGRGNDWRGDLRDLAGAVPAGERRVIVGDLGATPWNPAFRRLASGEWNDAADVVGRGLRPTWPSWTLLPVSPLDHVLVSGKLGVSGVDTANVDGTDHRALIVTLVVPSG